MNVDFHSSSVSEVLTALDTKREGLDEVEAKKRLSQFGKNMLDIKGRLSILSIFLSQFKNFIIYILLFAVCISVILGETVDAIVVSLILLLNAGIGFFQEWQAERRIQALSEMVPQTVQVYRDGALVNRPATEIVPGDVIMLEAGTLVPADARIIEASHARVVESSLTGESEPTDKQADTVLLPETSLSERNNMMYGSTLMSTGRVLAVVTMTGMQTEIGKIAGLLSETEQTDTPLQRQLDILGKRIGDVVIALCIGLFLYGVWREGAVSILMTDGIIAFFDATRTWIMIALSLAVAAVPEGLPAVVTIALSIGVKRMAEKQALVRHLSSVESLGQATVICSDKTGTLTQNKMTVTHIATLIGECRIAAMKELEIGDTDRLLLRAGALCNNAHIPDNPHEPAVGDPTEVALLQSLMTATGDQSLLDGWKRIDELAFDSDRKSMSTIDAHAVHGTVVHTKGAIERILAISTHITTTSGRKKITKQQREQLVQQAEAYATEGLRVLACAVREWDDGTVSIEHVEQGMTFVGMQAMIDPPHEVVPQAIATCKEAGIRVIMITGDNPVTAAAIAAQVGIEGETMLGDVFMSLSESEQIAALERVNIFSRVAPAHKYHIVSLLQEQGEIVAMTGDGVNDAPAIKKADFGIAMGVNGTDISKQASDMILLDDNFATIVTAVEEGRNIYQNIRKVINFLLSTNAAEVCIVIGAILMSLPLPLTAIMILWINLVTDGVPALALAVDPTDPHIMRRPPKDPKEQFITRHMLTMMGMTVLFVTIAVLGVFAWALQTYQHSGANAALPHAQTVALTMLILLEIVIISVIRRDYGLSLFSNRWLVWTMLATIGLHITAIHTSFGSFLGGVPMSTLDWGMVLIVLVGLKILSRVIPYISHAIHRTTKHQVSVSS